jgi:hypothetical protein
VCTSGIQKKKSKNLKKIIIKKSRTKIPPGDDEVHNWDPFGDIFNLEFDTTELQNLVREAGEIIHELSPRRMIRFGHAHARRPHAHEGM